MPQPQGFKENISESKSLQLTKEQILTAVNHAVEETTKYISERSRDFMFRMALGPTFDGSYYYWVGKMEKMGYQDVGLTGDLYKRQKTRALELGLPPLESLNSDFLALFHYTQFKARQNGAKQSSIVPKHFPGGPSMEETEANELIVTGTLQTMQNSIQPFALVIGSKNPPTGIMLSHAKYTMEEELRKKYPHIIDPLKELGIDKKHLLPASLSPYIIRGLLREDLGYEGLVVSDWYNMGAIRLFINKIRKESLVLSKMTPSTAIAVFAIYAGINHAYGLIAYDKDHSKEDDDEKMRIASIEKLYAGDKKFAELLDKLVMETTCLGLKTFKKTDRWVFDIYESPLEDVERLSFKDLRADIESPDVDKKERVMALKDYVKGLTIEAKLKIIGLASKNPINSSYERELFGDELMPSMINNFNLGHDLWSRWGILVLQFRKQFVESILSQPGRWPAIPKVKPSSGEDETKWITSLMEDKDFRKVYDSIDWNDPKIKDACKKVLKELMNSEQPENVGWGRKAVPKRIT
ncbi:TPA: hypothetical protein HA238_02380 [Candidatus Micrarchaeota archaeon]|nr:hypothetical protein [Candidatus Micrarchaeota archaeon]